MNQTEGDSLLCDVMICLSFCSMKCVIKVILPHSSEFPSVRWKAALLQPQLSKPNFCFYKLKHLAVILSLQKQNCCIEKVFVCACVHASKLEISLDGMNILGKICLHMSKCASIVQDMGWSITASWG